MTETQHNIFNHIEMLRAEAQHQDGNVDEYMAGAAPPVCSARIRERNDRILRIVQDFDNPQRTRMQYLRALAHNF